MSNHQPGMRPAGGSSSNLTGQVPMVSQAVMAQFAAAAAAGGQPRPGQLPVGMAGMPNLNVLQQHQVFLQHQQALMAAAGRAPSPGGAMPGMVTIFVRSDPSNAASPVILMPLPPEFVAAKAAFIQQYIANPNNHHIIKVELDRWNVSREASSGAGSDQPAAKRAKVDGPAGSAAAAAAAAAARPAGMPLMQHPAALAAMAGGRPPLPPGMALPGMMPQQLNAAQASAAAQLRLQQQLATKQFQPIIRPQSEDDKQYVPQARLQALVRQVGLGIGIQNAKATEDAEGALRAVAGDFISNAVSFAVSMARRRKSEEIEPADLLLYLERTGWV
jgi:histone H3/H4